MPAQFYQLSADQNNFEEIAPGAAKNILEVTDFLFSQNTEKKRTLQNSYQKAIEKYPGADAALGENLPLPELRCLPSGH